MTSEASTQARLRAAASLTGGFLWRNNSGAFDSPSEPGRWVRYGLANDSARINKVFKSSDLIGITPRIITPADVGRLFGIFTAIEVKAPGWHQIPSDTRATAQAAYIDAVKRCGGFAGFATHVDHLKELTR